MARPSKHQVGIHRGAHLKEGSVETATLLIIIVISCWSVAAVGMVADDGADLTMRAGG
jgi:hypothetical protein